MKSNSFRHLAREVRERRYRSPLNAVTYSIDGKTVTREEYLGSLSPAHQLPAPQATDYRQNVNDSSHQT